ncbi:MAG: formate--tetrahydrofolate ligase, partial [Anaerolineales bacterium]|nr:formate--tetrahydrofolate ligase [Anaerolineales bacterium]
ALKMHGGGPKVVAGKPLPPEYTEENLSLLKAGLVNLERHVQNARKFGVNVVVAINSFITDTPAEVEMIRQAAFQFGALDAVVSTHWADGGAGALRLAEAVVRAANVKSKFKFLYPLKLSIKEKIEKIAVEVYRADGVDYTPEAERQIARYVKLGYAQLPICMAKTHLSFSTDPNAKGAPNGFRITVREIRASVGAGFLYPILGEMRTMPGLPTRPAFYDIDLDLDSEKVIGLF